jgi:SAM-dependent methyltransferase
MKYHTLAKHYDSCFDTHGDSHLGVDWPNYNDTQVRYEIMLDIIKTKENVTLLDFGSGLCHLYDFIQKKEINNINYSALDINPKLINTCKEKYKHVNFYVKDILIDDNLPNFDYIVCNGTFTEKRNLTHQEMFEFMSKCLIKLWDKTNKGIAFNIMSKLVDWERDDLFHVSMDEIGVFLKSNLSKNFIMRNDYKLYEYTIYVYK